MDSREFDHIIAGAGLAGLSLACRLNRSRLRDRRTLVIDRSEKSGNDHTWCFWTDRAGQFEDAVSHRWRSLWFHGPDGSSRLLDIGAEGLEYMMVRSSDLYSLALSELRRNPAFEFVSAEIEAVADGTVTTSSGDFLARDFVFDSVTPNPYNDPSDHNLLQHFLGWVIETDEDVFDPDRATLFDFRVPQNGECRFVYILPMAPRRALVEFTVFSTALLERGEYARELSAYIRDRLGVVRFETKEEELGVIPMSDVRHETRPFPKVIRIGTSGGWVKPSTGYSFSRTQERVDLLVRSLEAGGEPMTRAGSAWKSLLDSVLLGVLEKGSVRAADVFEALFAGNPPGRVLRFLDEETGLAEDLKVMSSVPIVPFTRSFAREAVRRPFK